MHLEFNKNKKSTYLLTFMSFQINLTSFCRTRHVHAFTFFHTMKSNGDQRWLRLPFTFIV